MRSASSLFRWVLAGYLILLLNLGPSLHHAHFFGFHTGCSAETDAHACCGHCQAMESPAGDQNVPIGNPGSPVFGDSHSCAYCKFLDQCHISASAVAVSLVSALVALAPAFDEQASPVYLVYSSARGPPSLTI